MLIQLSHLQARIIGVLLEKEVTTPDQYPLSLNGLTLGCNQKSNREPVMNLTELEVQSGLDELRDKKLIFESTGSSGRVVKYKHRFCNTEFSDLKFSRQQLAIVCVLLLRGPQTPSELRTRTNRLAEFENVTEVEQVLHKLQALNDEQLVIKLAREPSKRESRYAHLFSDKDNWLSTSAQDDAVPLKTDKDSSTSTKSADQIRITNLENQVAALVEQVAELKELVDLLTE